MCYNEIGLCPLISLQWLSQLASVTIWRYTMLELYSENVIFYQADIFMFYNVQATYWTFVSKSWTPQYVIALRNFG